MCCEANLGRREGEGDICTIFEGWVAFGFDGRHGERKDAPTPTRVAPSPSLSGQTAGPLQLAVYMGFPAASQ